VGGHDIPGDVYLPLADFAAIYDNSDGEKILVAERRKHGQLVIHDADRWAKIELGSNAGPRS